MCQFSFTQVVRSVRSFRHEFGSTAFSISAPSVCNSLTADIRCDSYFPPSLENSLLYSSLHCTLADQKSASDSASSLTLCSLTAFIYITFICLSSPNALQDP